MIDALGKRRLRPSSQQLRFARRGASSRLLLVCYTTLANLLADSLADTRRQRIAVKPHGASLHARNRCAPLRRESPEHPCDPRVTQPVSAPTTGHRQHSQCCMHKSLLMMAAALAEGLRVSRRVAVVGGGSAGVAAARFLKQAGHKPNIFETGASFGGVWAEQPTNNVVYKNLRTNLPKQVMQSPDLDFPASLPSYVDGRALGAYISTYAEKFGVEATFGARVLDVTPLPDDRWRVTYENATRMRRGRLRRRRRVQRPLRGAVRPRNPGAR